MDIYQCKKCGTVVTSSSVPSTLNCPAGGLHQWTKLCNKGNNTYQCKKCGTVVTCSSIPSTLNCPAGGLHQWTKLA